MTFAEDTDNSRSHAASLQRAWYLAVTRGQLPVSMEQLNANPNFARYLIGRLEESAPTGSQEMETERARYLELRLLYNAVRQVAREFPDISEVLAKLELCETMCADEIGTHLFGVGPEDLEIKNLENDHRLPILIEKVGSLLEQQCMQISQQLVGYQVDGAPAFVKAKSLHIASILKERKDRVSAFKADEIGRYQRRVEKWMSLISIFGRCVELFSHLIEDFQLKYELPKNTAFTEYFAALVENMRLKLELIRLETLSQIFSVDVLEHLIFIRKQVDKRDTAVRNQKQLIEQQLHNYHAAGSTFRGLVLQYQQICDNIADAERDIQQLNF